MLEFSRNNQINYVIIVIIIGLLAVFSFRAGYILGSDIAINKN
jgi:hypothetical protein